MRYVIIELIGYLGIFFNTMSTLPQIIKTYNTKDASSLSFLFLLFWALGCGLLLIYSILTHFTIPIAINYITNVVFPCILIFMFLKYKKK